MSDKKKNAKMANRKLAAPRPGRIEDPRRFVVVRDGRQVYPGPGVDVSEADRLCSQLVEPASVIQVAT